MSTLLSLDDLLVRDRKLKGRLARRIDRLELRVTGLDCGASPSAPPPIAFNFPSSYVLDCVDSALLDQEPRRSRAFDLVARLLKAANLVHINIRPQIIRLKSGHRVHSTVVRRTVDKQLVG